MVIKKTLRKMKNEIQFYFHYILFSFIIISFIIIPNSLLIYTILCHF